VIEKVQEMTMLAIAPDFFVACHPSGRSVHVNLHSTLYAAQGICFHGDNG
jgi:hypothetical protein